MGIGFQQLNFGGDKHSIEDPLEEIIDSRADRGQRQDSMGHLLVSENEGELKGTRKDRGIPKGDKEQPEKSFKGQNWNNLNNKLIMIALLITQRIKQISICPYSS